jgi:flagellar hook-associated protein 3 FlgL
MLRFPDRILSDTVRFDLNTNLGNLTTVEQQLATGKRINTPSDDPVATASVLRYNNDIALDQQFQRTASDAKSRLDAADTALGSLSDVMQRVRELAVQAGSGALNTTDLTAIGNELNQLLGQAVQIGNTKVGYQYIFAGTKTTTPPFAAVGGAVPTSVSFNGDSNPIAVPTGQGTQTQVNVDGNATFMPVLNAIIQIRDAVNSNNTAGIQGSLTTIDNAMDGVLKQRGTIGATSNGLDALTSRIDAELTTFQSQRSQLEDTDMADAAVKLNQAQNVYQAALGAAAKVVQQSLADFLH